MIKTFCRILLLASVLLLSACSNDSGGSLDIRSEADLSGLTLATSNGSYYHNKFSKREDVKLFVTNNEADGLLAVRQGKADVYVADDVLLSGSDMERLGIRLAFRGEETFDVAFALPKGNDELREKLDSFLASAPLEKIIAHWVSDAPLAEEDEYEIIPGAAPLRCVCCVDVSPVSFMGDGEWLGMEPDILRRFAHSIGRPFELKYQSLASGIIALQTGQMDVLSSCLFVTEERKKAVDFSLPYYTCHPGYFVLDKNSTSRPGFMDRLKLNLVTDRRWKMITDGLLETVKITLLSILLGTVLGAGLCAMRRSRRGWLRRTVQLYDGFINGIPTLVLLLIMFYVVFASTGLNASMIAVVTFGLCFASAAGGIFDNVISGVPAGQTEAGLALGFSPLKTFTGIVLPQAIKSGLPLFAGQCVALLKSTSIVGYISIQDVTRASDLIRSRTFDAVIPLLIVTVLYFVLAWIIRKLLNLLLLKK